METVFYTTQQFYAFTKGILYILMIASLIGFAFFWKFLSGKDGEEEL